MWLCLFNIGEWPYDRIWSHRGHHALLEVHSITLVWLWFLGYTLRHSESWWRLQSLSYNRIKGMQRKGEIYSYGARLNHDRECPRTRHLGPWVNSLTPRVATRKRSSRNALCVERASHDDVDDPEDMIWWRSSHSIAIVRPSGAVVKVPAFISSSAQASSSRWGGSITGSLEPKSHVLNKII